MLRLGGFSPLCQTTHHSHHHHHTISQFLPAPDKTHQTHLLFPSNGLTHQQFRPVRTKVRVSGVKSRSKEGNDISLLEMEGLDQFLEEDDDDDEEEEDLEDDDDDDEGFVPLKNMKKWLANKPTGFGQGKAYDTSVEDKLLEEMERSRAAQLANLNKLKNSPATNANAKKKEIAPTVVPSGIRVRLPNLPKKKNIHKDLKLAFKGFPGILNISPAVLGNKKTRDPVCKGFAFVDFKSQDDANRFIQTFSGKSISFGKIQKEITCEIVNSKSANPELTQPRAKSGALPRLPDAGEDSEPDSGDDDTVTNSEDVSESEDDEERSDDNWSPPESENVSETLTSSTENSVSDSVVTTAGISPDTLASQKQEKVRVKKKKPVDKRKATKVPKLSIPGSANRLKVKEKAVLTDVFSKYAMQSASTLKRES